jgi:uncharacterized RDD family membrane protein YckC
MFSPDPTLTSWDDKLTIETPEQTSLELSLAGVGSRCMALVLDTLIQIAVLLVLLILLLILSPQFSSGATGLGAKGLWAQALIFFAMFVIYYGYFAFFETIWNGQTPGKRVAHLRVIQESGRPLQVWQAIARNLLRIVDQIPGFYAVGITSALLSRQNRRLGDFVAGTVVVHERPLIGIAIGWADPPAGAGTAAPLGVARLGPEEVRLIEAFLERRNFLDRDVRLRMARQISRRVSEKLGLDPQQIRTAGFVSEEALLEAVARERSAARSR